MCLCIRVRACDSNATYAVPPACKCTSIPYPLMFQQCIPTATAVLYDRTVHVPCCTFYNSNTPLCHMLRTPIFSRCLSNSTRRNGVVRTSAVINAVGQYDNRNNLFPSKSRTMWYFTSMCLVHVLLASFLAILMQLWLSTLSSNAFTSF